MIISAHLNFFKIKECGLYKYNDEYPIGLDVSETFEAIYNWVKGRDMAETIPWDPTVSKKGLSKCYCHDFYKCEESGDFLFVLWKSDTGNNGSILGAQANAKTGSSKVVEYSDNYNGTPRIWGRPCYYWIIPSLNAIVSLKVDHSVCDTNLFQEWVTSCINNKVTVDNKIRTTTPTGMIRFEFADQNGVEARTSFKFDVKLQSLDTGNAELLKLASKVTHIIKRETVLLRQSKDERARWVKIFDAIPWMSPKINSKSRQIEIRAEAKPTVAELKKIIEEYASKDRGFGDWDNIGFQTNDSTVWADKYRLHKQAAIKVDEDGVMPAAFLHAYLHQKRDFLLAEIIKEERMKKVY